MRALLQRVSSASVTIDGKVAGKINSGLVILLGIHRNDQEKDVDYLAEKCVNLRIFNDLEGKMNLSLDEVGGAALIISQFTLYGDCRKGRRPSYGDAARPEQAIPLYERFLAAFKAAGITTASGEFGAMMKVEINNDGPVTVMVESKDQ